MKKIIQFLGIWSLFCVGFIAPVSGESDLLTLHKQDVNFWMKPENKKQRDALIERHRDMTQQERNKNLTEEQSLQFDEIVKKAQEAQDQELIQSYKDGDKQTQREKHGSFFRHLIFGDGGWRERWSQYRAAKEAQNLIKKRQEEIKELNFSGKGKEFIQGLKSYEVEALQPWQIEQLCNPRTNFPKFIHDSKTGAQIYVFAQIKLFTPQQITYFTPSQIQDIRVSFLTKEQIQALTKNQIQALTADQIEGKYSDGRDRQLVQAGLQTLSWFTPEQISWFTPAQVSLWDDKLFQSLTTKQYNKMTSEQKQALNFYQVIRNKIHWGTGQLVK